MTIIPTTIPFMSTISLTDTTPVKIELTAKWTKSAYSFVLTNLSITSIYVSTKEWATIDEEYTLAAWSTVSFEYKNDTTFDLYIRWDDWDTFSYIIS